MVVDFTCGLGEGADAGGGEGVEGDLLAAPLLKLLRPVELVLGYVVHWVACTYSPKS